jgi:hypothetical protein
MKYRLAKPCDVREIVDIHYAVRETYPVGVFAKLGKNFLRQYYKIILSDKNQVVVCAEDENGKIQGFCSATLDVEQQFAHILRNKWYLGLAAIDSIFLKPSLFKSLISRYKSVTHDFGEKFIVTKGARGEYWAWSSANKDPISSMELHEVHLEIMKALGVRELYFEVDAINKKVFLFHKFNGAELIEKTILSDGRERAWMKYNLVDRKSII